MDFTLIDGRGRGAEIAAPAEHDAHDIDKLVKACTPADDAGTANFALSSPVTDKPIVVFGVRDTLRDGVLQRWQVAIETAVLPVRAGSDREAECVAAGGECPVFPSVGYETP